MKIIIFILALYCTQAQAQYTTTSVNKQLTTNNVQQQVNKPVNIYTTTTKQVVQQPVVQKNVYTNTTQKTTNTVVPNNIYTTSKKVQPTQPVQQKQSVSFRPTTQKSVVDDGEDELPSFADFKKKQQVGNQVVRTNQDVNSTAPRPLIIPKGEIWVSKAGMENLHVNNKYQTCNWRLVIQNRTDTTIERVRFELKFGSNINTYVIKGLKSGEYFRSENDSKGFCPAKESQLSIKILSCKFGDVTGNNCFNYFKMK